MQTSSTHVCQKALITIICLLRSHNLVSKSYPSSIICLQLCYGPVTREYFFDV